MERETKKTRLKESLKERLGEGYEIIFPDRPHGADEGRVLFGVMKDGEASGIFVSLKNSEFESLEDEEGIQKAAAKMFADYKQKRGFLNGPCLTLDNYREMKSKVIFVLDNEPVNAAVLSHIPYRCFFDMVMYYQLYVEGEESYCKTVVNDDLEEWHINEQDLYEAAMENTQKLLPPVLQIMKLQGGHIELVTVAETPEEILDYVAHQKDKKSPMYVLTNRQGWYGADCILYDHLLEQIADSCKDSLMILPVSMHYVVLIQNGKNGIRISEWKELTGFFRTLEKAESLSSHIYFFDRADHTLKIAAEENSQA